MTLLEKTQAQRYRKASEKIEEITLREVRQGSRT